MTGGLSQLTRRVKSFLSHAAVARKLPTGPPVLYIGSSGRAVDNLLPQENIIDGQHLPVTCGRFATLSACIYRPPCYMIGDMAGTTLTTEEEQ
jgi:hypothetical protein